MATGKLIAFEGGDGVGKATQSLLSVETLMKKGRGVAHFSFPRYETEVGKKIRAMLVGEIPWDPLMFQTLMLADKCDANTEISDLLASGDDVVCDRWLASAKVYGASDGLDPAWLERTHSVLAQPDLTILLSVRESVALARRPGLRDRYEKDRDKQVAVAARYEELARIERWMVINGEGTVEGVASLVSYAIKSELGI